MAHYADPDFWRHYRDLPDEVRELADRCFEMLKASPQHPSLHFRKIKGREGLWSARVGRDYRALATEVEDGLQWFWIGSHADYDRILS
jgi:mRNA-degrading endonuclease RelE of RelBE toxin-antitoxin system